MSPITHLFCGWAVAEAVTKDRRERLWISLAGVAPDLDGLGVLVDLANRALGRPETLWFGKLHHVLLHGLPGAVAFVVVAAVFGIRGLRPLAWGFASYHLHLICDVAGSRGPTPEEIWPIDYLSPISHAWTIQWAGQWALNAWPNGMWTLALMGWAIWRAVKNGATPVSLVSQRADALVVEALRARWRQWFPGSGRAPRGE